MQDFLVDVVSCGAIAIMVIAVYWVTSSPAPSRAQGVEYMRIPCDASTTCLERLNEYGAEGWELGASTFIYGQTTFWLQRKKQ